MRGIATRVRFATEGERTVLRFRLDIEGEIIPVEMRGPEIWGDLDEGDTIELPDSLSVTTGDATVRPSRITNHTTKSVVMVRDPTWLGRGKALLSSQPVPAAVGAITTAFVGVLLRPNSGQQAPTQPGQTSQSISIPLPFKTTTTALGTSTSTSSTRPESTSSSRPTSTRTSPGPTTTRGETSTSRGTTTSEETSTSIASSTTSASTVTTVPLPTDGGGPDLTNIVLVVFISIAALGYVVYQAVGRLERHESLRPLLLSLGFGFLFAVVVLAAVFSIT
jgi:hypothetical protein